MTFVSIEFFVLFGIVLGLYYFLPHRRQNYLLLIASLIFYGWWDWRFVALLMATSLMDFYAAQWIDTHRHPELSARRRKTLLTLAMIGNLSVLGIFKYYDFFAASFVHLGQVLHIPLSLPLLNVILPIGISFFTFHEMSYTIDVYRGQFRSVNDFVDYLLYVCFFPHMVAGPIQRASNLLPQIEKPRPFSWENIYSGLQLALFGFFKKIVIADNLAIVADTLTRAPTQGAAVIVATYAFAFQIYCDFSGYTDIARGVARMLGIAIPLNFDKPYLATNIREFWGRWHISLSSWLKDYLYIPLGGNRHGMAKTLRNLMITMVLGGLWHGAAWHFVAWGVFHGSLLCLYHLWSARTGRLTVEPTLSLWKRVLWAAFLFQVVCVGWSLFRASSLTEWTSWLSLVATQTHWRDLISTSFIKVVAFGAPLMVFEVYALKRGEQEPWRRWPVAGLVAFYLVLGYCIGWLGSPTQLPFIYFQF